MAQTQAPLLCSARLSLCIFVFCGLGILYMQRINMGIAIVCMVNNTALELSNSKVESIDKSVNSEDITCALKPTKKDNNITHFENGEFEWNKKQQGFILSVFFYGYIMTQILGGWLSLKIGGKLTAAFTILLGSVCTLLIPLAARTDYYFLIAIRFLTGFFHGSMFPSLGSIWTNWLPANERSRLLGLANSGAYIGNTIALPLGSFLCVHGFDNGWPSIFYIFGCIGVVWSILFIIFNADSPSDHKWINKAEVNYILESTKKTEIRKKLKTPWKSILTSKIVLTLNVCCFCFNTGNYLYLTQLPTYVNEVLKFDIKNNGFMSALPYISTFIVVNTSSILSDYLLSRNIIDRLVLRKVFSAIALLTPTICLLGLSFVTCQTPYLGVFLLTAGFAATGFGSAGGFFLSIYEVGGPFTSIIIGITNTVGTLPGILAPFLVGILTANRKQEEWRNVFLITACVYLIGFFAFLIWGDSSLQPWAKNSEDDEEQAKEEKEPFNVKN